MMRFILRWAGIITGGCMGSIVLTLLVGYVLPPEAEVVYAATLNQSDFDIFRMAINRHLVAAITHDSGNNIGPVWSPDGRQIAIISDRDGVYRLYLMDDQGRHLQRLTDEALSKHNPTWSPDGKSILYASEQLDYPQLMLIDPQTGTTQVLTTDRQPYITPDWAPDSQHVTFISGQGTTGDMNIFNLDVHNGSVRPYISTPGHDLSLSWSPDGHYLLFTVDRLPPSIYLWDTKTSQFMLLRTAISPNSVPNWSSDDRYIIYTAFTTTGKAGIYRLAIQDCLQTTESCLPELITLTPGVYASPRWRPLPK
jgi:TolB protein